MLRLGSNLLVCCSCVVLPTSSLAETNSRVLAKSDARFNKAISVARQEMATSLEREVVNIEKRKFKTAESSQKAKEQIKLDQSLFATKGLLPFSSNTRTAARKYLSSIKKANVALTNAYAAQRLQLLKARKQEEADSLVRLRTRRVMPRLVAVWKSTSSIGELAETWKLYDDLSAEVVKSNGDSQDATWNLDSTGLTLTSWSGGRQTADRWTIDSLGQTFIAKQGRKEIYRGELVPNLKSKT